jgi:hypothetical protein
MSTAALGLAKGISAFMPKSKFHWSPGRGRMGLLRRMAENPGRPEHALLDHLHNRLEREDRSDS